SHARVGYRMTVVSSWGCLGLGGERRQCRLITGHEDSPPRPASCPGHRYGRAALFRRPARVVLDE
ncbi:hypothetical protein FNJ47_46440, partial [Bradyrhizobium sp. UFLA 03-164]|nr:hypothetical protein [Bradyrhizobium uaiense]